MLSQSRFPGFHRFPWFRAFWFPRFWFLRFWFWVLLDAEDSLRDHRGHGGLLGTPSLRGLRGLQVKIRAFCFWNLWNLEPGT
jgi:hypothetical protein